VSGVVLEHGLGGGGWVWDQVRQGLDGRFATLAYDRVGLSLAAAEADLERRLAEADLAPPYILVGHSLGGLHVRWFAERHADRVAALVLVDPSHERQYGPALRLVVQALAGAQRAAPHVFSRLYRRQLSGGRLPAEYRGVDPAVLLEATSPAAVRQMGRTLPAVYRDARRLGGRGSLGDLPLVVLAAGRPMGGPKLQAKRRRELEELVALSSRGELRFAEGSGHLIPLERPDAIVQAILDVSDSTFAS
jgi:pimeloyl-ACP methyl ester carboxylesterase